MSQLLCAGSEGLTSHVHGPLVHTVSVSDVVVEDVCTGQSGTGDVRTGHLLVFRVLCDNPERNYPYQLVNL